MPSRQTIIGSLICESSSYRAKDYRRAVRVEQNYKFRGWTAKQWATTYDKALWSKDSDLDDKSL